MNAVFWPFPHSLLFRLGHFPFPHLKKTWRNLSSDSVKRRCKLSPYEPSLQIQRVFSIFKITLFLINVLEKRNIVSTVLIHLYDRYHVHLCFAISKSRQMLEFYLNFFWNCYELWFISRPFSHVQNSHIKHPSSHPLVQHLTKSQNAFLNDMSEINFNLFYCSIFTFYST